MFTVTEIIDEKTIRVNPRWSWNSQVGDKVTIRGLETKSGTDATFFNLLLKSRLETLLLNKTIGLHAPVELLPNSENNNIKCEVRLENVNISNYFPEAKIT